MTSENLEQTNKHYEYLIMLLRKCVLSEKISDRVMYGTQLSKAIKKDKEQWIQMYDAVDDMIEKMCKTAKDIRDYNEWSDCLMLAMDDRKSEICHTAKLIHKGIEKYKKGSKRRD